MLITSVFGNIVIKCSKDKHFILISLHVYFHNLGLIFKLIALPQPSKVAEDHQKQLTLIIDQEYIILEVKPPT